MSEEIPSLEIEVRSVRWTVGVNDSDSGIFGLNISRSHEFVFEDRQWCLSLLQGVKNGAMGYRQIEQQSYRYYRLALEQLSIGKRRHPPFAVHVRVADADGFAIGRLSTDEERFKAQKNGKIGKAGKYIWTKTESDIVRDDPDFCRKRELRFRVELRKERRKILKDPAETQTRCTIPPCDELMPCITSLSKDFALLTVQGSDSDVEFRCEGQSFQAHGTVLCARSPVMARMLSSDMVEGRTRVIKIPDMTPEVLQIFLGYLYTGTTPYLTFEVAWTLYESADQYAVLGLARRCSGYLVEQLSETNAWDVLVLAGAHRDGGFVEEVVDYMVDRKILKASDEYSIFLRRATSIGQESSRSQPFLNLDPDS